MDIVEFAERVLGIELLECQKEILRDVEKLPRDTRLVMGRRGLITMVPKKLGCNIKLISEAEGSAMSCKKYELTDDTITVGGHVLHKIRALVSFGNVVAGDLGGYVESEKNLSHEGNAWVYGNARVCDNARVCGNAEVYGNARVCDNARVCGNAEVCDYARVYDNAIVRGDARVYGNARVCDYAWVYGDARVYGNAKVCSNKNYTTIHGFGTCCRTTTFFRCTDGLIRVVCGCFYGTIPEFREQVIRTRDGKIAKEYLMIADLMEEHFKEEGEKKNESTTEIQETETGKSEIERSDGSASDTESSV